MERNQARNQKQKQKQKQKQIVGLAIFGVIIIASILGFYILSKNQEDNPNHNNNDNQTLACDWAEDPFRKNYTETVFNVTLIIIYNNGTNESYYNNTLTNSYTSAFDLLRLHAEVEYYCQKFGQRNSFFVTSINGRAQNSAEGKYWQYWVNGQYAQVASNVYVCHDNDIIEWRYS